MMQGDVAKGGFWSGLTGLLAGTSVFLAVLLLLQTLLLGKPGEVQVDDEPLPEINTELQRVVLNREDPEAYAGILQKPLFFPDRILPEIEGEPVDPEGVNPDDVPVTELDARLAGVIISPDRRIAMITDGKTSKTTIMREGMSLEGDQAAWQISEIGERSVSFAAGERTAELELKVNTRGLQAPAARASRGNRGAAANAANSSPTIQAANNNAAVNSAAEVRRRIAERRAKLRAAREQQAKQSGDEEN